MLMSNLSIIVRYSRTFSERALQDYGLGFPEQLILMQLAICENVNQDTFAHHFMIDKGSIAKTICKLEEKKLIKRTENPNNKREKLISIAPMGADILSIMENTLKEWNEVLFSGLTKEEITQFEKLSGLMAENVAKSEGRMEHFNENAK
jgi:DNA-binding MarR family transcriptional regulator